MAGKTVHFISVLLLSGYLLSLSLWAYGQEFDNDSNSKPISGHVETKETAYPPYVPPSNLPPLRPNTPPSAHVQTEAGVTLQGSVTLKEAIQQEKGIVNWYAWYLACRDYLTLMGGLGNCPRGTMIRFHKDGHVDALSPNPYCLMTLSSLNFPLPKNTKLDVVAFPVRAGTAPPASQTEVLDRTGGGI
jgi:hypothetical protein